MGGEQSDSAVVPAAARTAGPQATALDWPALSQKRRLLLLVRTGLTLAIAYLLLFSVTGPRPSVAYLAFVLLYVTSNVLLAVVPVRILALAAFDWALVFADTAALSFALYLLPQADSDVFVFYFAIILLAAVSDRLVVSLIAPVLVSLAYLAYLMVRHDLQSILQPALLLRVPFFLLAGTFYGFLVDRVRRGQAAARAAADREQARTEFLSMITHDLKQPLWVAQQSAALLYDKLARRAPDERPLIAQVMVNLRRMEGLALNFLELDQIEARGVRINPRRAALNDVIEGMLDTARPALDLKGLSVQLDLDENVPETWFDPLQLERALTNIIDNAIKFTPEGGAIICHSAAESGGVAITLGDTGPGISAEKAATLFTRFQGGHDSGARRSTGLGLYITRAIIAAHGGTIALDDTRRPGAWFIVRLPLTASASRAPAPPLREAMTSSLQ